VSRDLRALPKAHLHVHVESTIRPDTLRELADANGVPLPPQAAVSFPGFRAFADHNALIRACLRRPEDFERIGREYCVDETAQGVGYAEVTFAAGSHGERLGELEMPLAALLRGLAEGCAATGLECRVLLDHSRRRSVDRAWRTLELARRYADQGVIGIGLAGEESYPLAPFAEVCAAAERDGLHRVHHAGEAAGPDSVREALTLGRAERVGHGIRVLDDPALVAELAERGIPLEVCPSSNVVLGFAPSWPEHPLPRLLAAGLTVTLNTDIPLTTGVSLTGEYARARDTFGYSDQVLADLALASVSASFAPEMTTQRLCAGITAWLRDGDSLCGESSEMSYGTSWKRTEN
jgi:adenosine deaminase